MLDKNSCKDNSHKDNSHKDNSHKDNMWVGVVIYSLHLLMFVGFFSFF